MSQFGDAHGTLILVKQCFNSGHGTQQNSKPTYDGSRTSSIFDGDKHLDFLGDFPLQKLIGSKYPELATHSEV